jgi:Fe2+ transport system protein B
MIPIIVHFLLFSVEMTRHGRSQAAFFTTTTQTPTRSSRSTCDVATLTFQNKHNTQMKLNLASASSSLDDDIKKQVAKAKELLEKAKAKQAEEQESAEKNSSRISSSSSSSIQQKEKQTKSLDEKRSRVTKSKNEGTGLITTDGDLMALLSEEEEWELKALEDVFENEIEMDDHRGLADRDVAASIFNLRMTLQNEDYKKIFDSRNRWIGEDN